jgi:hypothetical protein
MPQRAGIQSLSRGLRRAAHSIDLQSSDVSWRGFTAVRNNGAACRSARVSAIARAQRLGQLLQKTLDEEKAIDKKLTALAESKINLCARMLILRRPKLESKRRADGFGAMFCVRRPTG